MNKITVNLYWIRHAFSCANILQHGEGGLANIVRPMITIDPALTTAGVEQAKALNTVLLSGEIKNKFNIILCSNLRRAMETAMYAFNNINTLLYVVPYISEARNPYASALNIDKENAPLSADELEKYYLEIRDKFKIQVNFNLLKELDKFGKLPPNYDNFIKIVLPKIINKLHNENTYDIAIVSHSHFIKQHLSTHRLKNASPSEIKNTQIWMESVELTTSKCVDSYKHIDVNIDKCNDNACKLYDGKPIPTKFEMENDDRCSDLQKSKLYTMALESTKSKSKHASPKHASQKNKLPNLVLSKSAAKPAPPNISQSITPDNLKKQLSVKIITWNMGTSIKKNINLGEEIKTWNIKPVSYDIIFITFQETNKKLGDSFKNILDMELNEYTIFSEGYGSSLAPNFYVYGFLCIKKTPLIIINKVPIENNASDKTIDTTCITKKGICTKPSVEFGIVLNNIKLIFIGSHLPVVTKGDPTFGYKERKDAMKIIYNNVIKNVSKSIGGVDMIFWAGDMNYRVNANKTEQLDTILNNIPNELPELTGFKEQTKTFKHTCRLLEYDGKQNYEEFVSKRKTALNGENGPYDPRREPSYCDRVIFKGNLFLPIKYYSLPPLLQTYPKSIAYSDHEPVFLTGIIKPNTQLGGSDNYDMKYYKYKAKYLALKNQ